jgi:hypothetical protein
VASQGQTDTGVGLGGTFGSVGLRIGGDMYARSYTAYKYGPAKYKMSILRSNKIDMISKHTVGGPLRSSVGKVLGMNQEDLRGRKLGLSTLPYSPGRFSAGLSMIGEGAIKEGELAGLNVMRTLGSPNTDNLVGHTSFPYTSTKSEYADRLLGTGRFRGGANIPGWMKKKLGGETGESIADIILGLNVNYSGGSALPKIEDTANILKKASNWVNWRGSIGREVAERGIGELGKKVALTTLGRVGASFIPGIGKLWLAYQAAELVYFAGSAAYKLGEAYYWKIPKAAYQSVNTIATRGAFMSVAGTSFLSQTASNRGRAVQAIQGSKMNARSALGQEAGLLAGHFS